MHLVMIKDRNGKNTTEADEMKEEAVRIHRRTKEVLMTKITMMV